MEVEFGEEEIKEYAALDKAALDFYRKFKNGNGHTLSKHYLLLTQKLTPLRIAASGGRVPIDDDGDKVEDPQGSDDDDSPKKKKGKKEQRFSEFAYNSKVNALVAELKQAREEDPQCTFCMKCSYDAVASLSNTSIPITPPFSQKSCFLSIFFDSQVASAGASKAWLPVQDVVR